MTQEPTVAQIAQTIYNEIRPATMPASLRAGAAVRELFRPLAQRVERAEADLAVWVRKVEDPAKAHLHYASCPYKPFAEEIDDSRVPEGVECTCAQEHMAAYWKGQWMLERQERTAAQQARSEAEAQRDEDNLGWKRENDHLADELAEANARIATLEAERDQLREVWALADQALQCTHCGWVEWSDDNPHPSECGIARTVSAATDPLQARIDDLEEKLSGAIYAGSEDHEYLKAQERDWRRSLDAVKADLAASARLVEALRGIVDKHAVHSWDCSANKPMGAGCSCGLSGALLSLDAPASPTAEVAGEKCGALIDFREPAFTCRLTPGHAGQHSIRATRSEA